MRRTAALLLLGAVLLTGCGDGAADDDAAASEVSSAPSPSSGTEPLVVTVAEDDGKDAQAAVLSVGQLVYVDLATCGGCGYEWTVDTAPDAKVATREEVAQPTPAPPAGGTPLTGVPTTTRIAFRATGGGSAPVSIGYHGPASAKADRVVVLTITVKSKGSSGSASG